MSRKLLTPDLHKQLREDQIVIVACLGIKKQDCPPFFIAGIAPADENDFGAVLDTRKSYATATADTVEEAVTMLRDKLWSGL